VGKRHNNIKGRSSNEKRILNFSHMLPYGSNLVGNILQRARNYNINYVNYNDGHDVNYHYLDHNTNDNHYYHTNTNHNHDN